MQNEGTISLAVFLSLSDTLVNTLLQQVVFFCSFSMHENN